MALNPATLQTALMAIFNAMNSMTENGDAYCVAEMEKAIKTFTLTGQVAAIDTGAAPAGSYAGAGVGVMTIDADSLEAALLATFQACYNNDGLADHMAADIDNACKAGNTVATTSTGTVTTPLGATFPFSGPGQGKFTGNKATIAAALKACFSAMNGMAAGGNEYYAAQLAAAYYAYLTAGAINVTLKPPFVSGSGTGRIA